MLTVKSINPDLNLSEDKSNKLEIDNSAIDDSDSNTESKLDLAQGLFNNNEM